MKKIVLLALIIYSNSWAQYSFDWLQEAGNFNLINSMMAVDNNDDVIVTGYFIHENIYTRKYDIAGNLLWEMSDGSGIQSNYQHPLWINSDNNNDIFVVGYRYTGTSERFINAIVVLKYSATGTLLWKQNIPIVSVINSQISFNLRSELDSMGNLYIGTHGVDPAGFVFIKLDTDGNTIFYHNNIDNAPKGFRSMRLKGDKVILTGRSADLSLAPVVAWDTSGNLLWTKAVLGRSGYDIEIDDSGDSYLYTSYPNQSSGNSGEDLLIYKLDHSGNTLWSHNYDFGGQDFAGRFTLKSGRISMISYYSLNSYFNWRTIQLDLDGNQLWNTVYDGTSFNDEYPYYIAANDNGEVVVTGIGGPSPDPNNQSYIQMVITNYSNSGEEQWMELPNIYGGAGLACDFASDRSLYVISYYNMSTYHYNAPPLGVMDILNDNDLAIYPNPFSDVLHIEGSSQAYPIEVMIYDMTGKLVVQNKVNSNENTLNLYALKTGMYVCHMTGKDYHKTVKLVKS